MPDPRTLQKIEAVILHIATDKVVDVTAAYRSAGFKATSSTYRVHGDHKGPRASPQERVSTNIDLGPERVVLVGPEDSAYLAVTCGVAPITSEVHYRSIKTKHGTLLTRDSSPIAASPEAQVRVAPNTVFALAGLIYVEIEAARHADTWRKRLAPDAEVYTFYDSHQFALGPHYLNWLSPREYRHYYAQEWRPTSPGSGGLAAIHVLAENLDKCAAMIASSGRAVKIIEHEHNGLRTIWVPPESQDGLPFHITEQAAEEWAQARSALTGERFTLPGD